jgi:hypothetical protein
MRVKTYLSGNACGNNNDLDSLKSFIELVSCEAFDLIQRTRTEVDEYTQLALYRTTYQAAGVNVADICSHTRCTTNIVKVERGYKRISFEEQRERLANSSTGTKHSNFCLPWGARGEGTGLV